MAEDHIRSFTTKRGEFKARILAEELPEATGTGSERAKSDRKFNIRIRQDDICLFDTLAKLHGVTRSRLINEILHEIMRDELMSIEDDDARVMLAHVADQSVSYDDIAQPWVNDALGSNFRGILQSMLDYGNVHGQPPENGMPSGYKISEEDNRSPAYLGLRAKLKGASQ